MERKLDFKGLIKETQWNIIKQFFLNLIIAYIFPLSTISLDVYSESYSVGSELLNVFFNVFSWIYISISLIIIVSINIKSLLKRVKREMDIVYHGSMWITTVNSSSSLTILEFIEKNKHIESMQKRIKNLIQIEKEQKEDVLFKVSAMAHDLKTPLTVIKGNSELLQLSELPDVDNQCLKDIEKASYQLENYFSQLINYSKTLYLDRISLNQYNLNDLAAMIDQECAYLIGDRASYDYISKINNNYKLDINLDLMMRSIANIINNAVTYSSDSQKQIKVTLEVDNQNMMLSIWNSGSKFSEEVLSNFGKLFYREDTSRNNQLEHFGIGLAFVKQVMIIHSGELNLYNSGEGSVVKLKFPIKNNR